MQAQHEVSAESIRDRRAITAAGIIHVRALLEEAPNIAQGAACLAVFFLAKSEKLKGLAGASGVSAVLGITEPAIFGVNLRLRWPFYIGIGTAAIGGALIALFDIKAVALGAAGFLGVVSIDAPDMVMFLV